MVGEVMIPLPIDYYKLTGPIGSRRTYQINVKLSKAGIYTDILELLKNA
jgi:hypothetical protein